jgi:hypothetical protein
VKDLEKRLAALEAAKPHSTTVGVPWTQSVQGKQPFG